MGTLQDYYQIGLFILILLVLIPAGWFIMGFSVRTLFLVFARSLGPVGLFRARLLGGGAGLVVALLLWGGFGGFGDGLGFGPGFGLKQGNSSAEQGSRTSLISTPQTDQNPSTSSSAPAAAGPNLPPAITTEGSRRQVRIALLGDETQPRYQLGNRFFVLMDEQDRRPLSTDEVIARLDEWKTKHQVEHIVLQHAPESADLENPQVRKLQKAVQGQNMQFTTKPVLSGKFLP